MSAQVECMSKSQELGPFTKTNTNSYGANERFNYKEVTDKVLKYIQFLEEDREGLIQLLAERDKEIEAQLQPRDEESRSKNELLEALTEKARNVEKLTAQVADTQAAKKNSDLEIELAQTKRTLRRYELYLQVQRQYHSEKALVVSLTSKATSRRPHGDSERINDLAALSTSCETQTSDSLDCTSKVVTVSSTSVQTQSDELQVPVHGSTASSNGEKSGSAQRQAVASTASQTEMEDKETSSRASQEFYDLNASLTETKALLAAALKESDEKSEAIKQLTASMEQKEARLKLEMDDHDELLLHYTTKFADWKERINDMQTQLSASREAVEEKVRRVQMLSIQMADTQAQLRDRESRLFAALQEGSQTIKELTTSFIDAQTQLQDTQKQFQDIQKHLQDTQNQLKDTENRLWDAYTQLQVQSSPPAPTDFISCPICLCSPTEAASSLCSTTCGHLFCERCVQSALSNDSRCPVCKRQIGQSGYHKIYLGG